MWAATYKFIALNDDGTKTAYYIFLIESSIDSVGKKDKYYFRNKYLTINIDFYSTPKSRLISNTTSSTDAITSYTNSFGIGLSAGVEVGSECFVYSVGVNGPLIFN